MSTSSEKLKLQTKVKGNAIVDFGSWSVAINDCNIYTNGWGEKELIILIQDKANPERKVQLTFDKPVEFVEKKKEDTKEEKK